MAALNVADISALISDTIYETTSPRYEPLEVALKVLDAFDAEGWHLSDVNPATQWREGFCAGLFCCFVGMSAGAGAAILAFEWIMR